MQLVERPALVHQRDDPRLYRLHQEQLRRPVTMLAAERQDHHVAITDRQVELHFVGDDVEAEIPLVIVLDLEIVRRHVVKP
ncbi:MAG: hypothetical protein ABIR55_03110 [Burkholderiaceae bacterium]